MDWSTNHTILGQSAQLVTCSDPIEKGRPEQRYRDRGRHSGKKRGEMGGSALGKRFGYEWHLLKHLATEAHGITRKKNALNALIELFPCASVANLVFLLMTHHKVKCHSVRIRCKCFRSQIKNYLLLRCHPGYCRWQTHLPRSYYRPAAGRQ